MGNKFLEELDSVFSHLTFDQTLAQKIRLFKISWSSKTDDYVDFITSPLIGVYRVRFSTKDEGEFFNTIYNIDSTEIENILKRGNYIPKNFKVAMSSINLTILYTIHQFYLQPFSKEYLESIITELYNILAFKMLGSIFSNFFPYGVDVSLAQSAYQNLSDKYMIKKEGSWERVLINMSSLLYPSSLHGSRIKNFSPDDYIRVINDVNTRFRSLVKNYASVIYTMRNDPSMEKKIISSSLLQDSEDGEAIREITAGTSIQLEYIRMLVPSPNDFINDVKVKLVCNIMGNIKFDKLKAVLYYISLHNSFPKNGEIDFVSVAIKQSRAYLQAKGLDKDVNKRVMECLKVLKRYYSASKVKILDIIKMKEYLDGIVRTALKNEKNWIPAPLVIGTILYIFLISLK